MGYEGGEMVFSEKLKELRIKKGMSPEDLSEILDVSRQSVSRYENGTAQPAFDKLLLISNHFNVTIDFLLDNSIEINPQAVASAEGRDKITIISKIDKKMSSFYKFLLSPVVGKKDYHPEILLLGVDGHSFWGDSTIALGWYRNRADAEKELREILETMSQGISSYELHHYTNVRKKGIFDFEMI